MSKRVEKQRSQSTVINSLSETKEFDKINTVRGEMWQTARKPCTPTKIPVKQNCSYFGSSHLPRQCPALC